jgi:demethylmenaquinone methyltransferase/2-methoxy-6-polyprenyl-1,4-benzoquinol methylase
MNPPPVATREIAREERFNAVWTQELNDVFADVAPYYDQANYIASLGLWGWFLRKFMATVDIKAGERVLDVCAGTNAIGIALLKREPTLEVHAIDRSAAMQEVGRRRAEALGFRIRSVIDDVHTLPYPDNTFDVVTLQFASRHLRIRRVAEEIRRVLKPGGRFYHSDMLRPGSPVVEKLYYAYFIQALQMFYSAQELSDMLEDAGFRDVTAYTVFSGMLGFHRAVKPPA